MPLIDPFFQQRTRQQPQAATYPTAAQPQAPPGGGGAAPPEQGPQPPDATGPKPAPTPTPDPGGIWGAGPRPPTGRIKYGPNGPYWDATDTGPDQTAGGTPTPAAPAPATPAPYPGTGVFDDPATKHFEELLNQRINELLGPAYTPAQMDLQQTQALDPMEREHQQARQTVIQRLASHGIPPSSGIVERALEDVDRQYQQLRTTTHAGFATKAIDRTDTNRNQAVGLAATIPNLAWSRVTGAASQVNPFNSPQLAAIMSAFQKQGYDMNSDFMKTFFDILKQSGLI